MGDIPGEFAGLHGRLAAMRCEVVGETKCLWCNNRFTPRRGGSPQRFCSAKHRSMFWSALRRWGERAVAAGILTVADIRNGDPAAGTLLQGTTPPTPENQSPEQYPMPVAPRDETPYTRQLELERLMAQAISMRRRG
jgi:hypothetical protein